MGKKEKLLGKILSGQADYNIPFNDLINLLLSLGHKCQDIVDKKMCHNIVGNLVFLRCLQAAKQFFHFIKKVVVEPVEMWKNAHDFGTCGKSVEKWFLFFNAFSTGGESGFSTFPQVVLNNNRTF